MLQKNNKILFILHCPPPVHGSAVIGLQIKDSATINAAFDCRFINLNTSKSIGDIGKNAFSKILRYFSIIWKVLFNLIVFRPGLCYFAITAKGIGFYKDFLLVLLVKIFRIKLVYHFHNKGVSTGQHKWLDNLLYRFSFKSADVILLSPLLYSDIQKYVSLNAVHYCPNGIMPLVNDSQKLATEKKDLIEILFLGNMIETKGVYILLDACKILKQKAIIFHCTFVGGWSDITETQLQERISLMELTDSVSYAGKKEGKAKHDFLVKADIFVFPTYYDKECFPLVLLEAMQFNLPIISTYEGGIRDIVQDGITGFLVPQKDAVALAQKLEQLIDNGDLRKVMGEKGKIRYEKNFTLHRFENNLITILKDCLVKIA